MTAVTRAVWLTSLVSLLSLTPGAAYYHYIHYTNAAAPFTPIPERFDLATLPNKTVTFFVSEQGPAQYGLNDSFASVLSQIAQAAQTWNAVETSDLRVAFGGLHTPGTPESSAGAEIVFEDLPPGVLGYAGPVGRGAVKQDANGEFVPITHAIVHLGRDLTRRPGPSYSDNFFTTAVHEMGHALGLQHSFTAATMSTFVTRATSRAKPLDADDIAGISFLYPRGSYPASFGSITGRVTSGGQGVHLASVVALPPVGSAVSALTNPDGTYEIAGIPPGNYFVYVHPLPPTADIVFPLDMNGQPVAPSGPTETLFYPGTRGADRAIGVRAGRTASGIDFSLQTRSSVAMYDVSTYSYFGTNAVSPAYLNTTSGRGTIVASGTGITAGSDIAPGLSVQIPGGVGSVDTMQAYGSPTVLALYPTFSPFSQQPGPHHLIFQLPDDVYVQPSAVILTQKQPPSISAVTTNPDGTVLITGTNLGSDSRVFLDGLPAVIRQPFSGSDQLGGILVAVPPGAADQVATITVVNSDGQTSMFTQEQAPPTYSYSAIFSSTPPPQIFVSPQTLPAGTTAMIDVQGINTQFSDGRTTLGFGSADISVSRVWVLSPTHLIANVSVAAGAAATSTATSFIAGFQFLSQPGGFAITPAVPKLPNIQLPLVNATQPQNGVYAGSTATLSGTDLAAGNNVTVTLNDQPVQVISATSTQVRFQVPTGFPAGPAILRLNNGQDKAYPVVVPIDDPPPVIMSVSGSPSPRAGDVISLRVAGLSPSVTGAPNRLRVSVGGTSAPVVSIIAVADQPDLFQVQFVLPGTYTLPQTGGATGEPVLITVGVEGEVSDPVPLTPRG